MSARKVFSDFADIMAPERVSWRNLRSRATAAERECDQLRAERDQALTLLRQVAKWLQPPTAEFYADQIRRAITSSGLLDDEGQQR